MDATELAVIDQADARAQRQLDALLASARIRRDAHLDYSVGMFDDEGRMIATGSAYGNTLRCLAVDENHRGQGLLAPVLSFLIEREVERGYGEVFLYTKPDSARFFGDMGFAEIARVPEKLVFMSNHPHAFASYLDRLQRGALPSGRACAVVMNANPFTLGHLHLLERASMENDAVHVFVVSEDNSLFSFRDRYRLVKEGSAHLGNVICHPSGSYIVSNATFPSYFLSAADSATEIHAHLDAEVFSAIAQAMNITGRYVGEEPFSQITQIYNRVLGEILPPRGVALKIMPRFEHGGVPVSASLVRQYIHDGQLDLTEPLVPRSTYEFLLSDAAGPTIERIVQSNDVRHA